MKKLFLLLTLLGMVATGCSKDEGGSEDNIPKNIFFGLDKESATFSPDGGSVDVIVYSNYKWEISGTSDWCTPSVKSGDANEDGQKVTFSADVAYDDREVTFWFRCTDKQIKFVVSQKLKEVIIPDANNTFNIPAEGGVAVISYQTSVDCDIIIPDEAQDWITIAPASRGLVSENINLDIAENTTYSARTAVIKVVAKDNAELAVEYTINQEQNDAVLANGNTEFTISGREQQITIKHKANVDCEVIIPDEAQYWVTIAPATRGLSTYSTTLNIAENNSGEERSCVVKVTSQGDNKLSAEYTIIQNPRYCLYYTSNDGKKVTPYDSSAFGATIISNTYIDGVGAIDFNAPITTIGKSAFYNCSSLTSVTIPDSVTTIGNHAFWGCSSLTSVTIPNSVTTIGGGVFCDCSSLTSVTIPDSVATIGDGAFYGCHNLSSVTIPDSVTAIGDYAFYYCSSLISVTISDSVTTIGFGAFAGCYDLTSVTIPDSVTTIGDEAFQGCSSLTSVPIPDSVISIGNYAFGWCESLTSVPIPDSVISIGNYAFGWCESLTSVTIPDSVTKIGQGAFQGCNNLTSITIPDSVTTIGGGAFAGCNGLQEFNGKFASEDGRCLIIDGTLNSFAPAGLTEYTIPDSVTEIGYAAFYGCSSLTSVTIGDSVTTIGGSAFSDCKSLTSVTIPDSVTEIGGGAFQCCFSLTSVTIGDSVTTIGVLAFAYCYDLTSVYCKATTSPVALLYNGYWDAFDDNAPNRKIYVPTESVNAYKSAQGWSEYKSDIVGYNFENGVVVTPKPANNEIWYTNGSTTKATTPYKTNVFGANIVSNTYDAAKECWVIKFEGKVTKIGDYAFYDRSSLTSVTIPDSVTEIGYATFQQCSSLICVTIPDSVTAIGDFTFALCSSLTSVTIGDSVTSIGDYTFANCSSLQEFNSKFASDDGRCLIIDGTLNSFAPAGLTEYTIPDSVTTIGDWAFRYCSSLTSVTIGDSVTTIGYAAFANCGSLTSVYCKPTTPPAGDDYMFSDNASGCKIYVPMDSVEAYKSAYGWSIYASDIVGYNF